MPASFPLWLFVLLLLPIGKAAGQSRSAEAEKAYDAALKAYRNGDLVQARVFTDQSLSLQATSQTHYLSGMIHEAQSKPLRAVADYEAVLQLEPDHREARFQKALIYLQNGNPSQALADFNELIRSDGFSSTRGIYFQLDPRGAQQNKIMSMATLEAELYHYRGQAHEKLRNLKEALSDYQEAIQRDSIADYFVSRALLYNRMQQPSAATADLRMALQLDPLHQLAWYNLALIAPDTKLPEMLIADETFAPTLGLLGARAMETGDYKLALKYYNQSLKNDSRETLSYINRGRTLLKLGHYEQARADFQEALRLEPSRLESLYLIGNSYFYEKDHEAAVAYYNQYLVSDPTYALVWYNAAMSYLQLDNATDGCNCLKRAQTLGMMQAEPLIARYCQ